MDLEPKVYRKFITESERQDLLQHANTIPLFVNDAEAPYGTRNYRRIDGTNLANSLVNDLFKKITATLGIETATIDPKLGQIVSILKPGGFVHLHKDIYLNPKYKNNHNLRFNIMVDRGDDISYNPIIDGKVYEVGKCDAWCFNASKYKHKTEAIKGPENRIVYQFGFIV